MGDKGNNDFLVNSKGRCFICLDKVEADLETGCSSRCYTLQCLSRYLKMDLTKVFSQKGFIPPSLLAQVKRSTLKAELCGECARLTKSFSRLYQQSKKIEMEMDLKLAHIHGKLMKTEKLGGVWKSEEDKRLIEIVEVIRTEAMEKCSSRMEHMQPRVRVPKLTRKEVKACLNDKKAAKRTDSAGFEFNSDTDVKNDIQADDFALDDDNGNNFNDEVNRNSDHEADWGSDPRHMQERVKTASTVGTSVDDEMEEQYTDRVPEGSHEIVSPLTSKTLIEERKYTIDPKTGKYRCKLCLKEFGKSVGFKYHYESIHLKIRYKCNLCEKQFSTKPNYNTHLRSAHLGVRFQCTVCNKQFTSKTYLTYHQRKKSCKEELLNVNSI